MSENNNNSPWLAMLLQGVIEPQIPCRELSGQTLVNALFVQGKEVGHWWMRIEAHRFSIRLEVTNQNDQDPNETAIEMHKNAVKLVNLALGSQSIYSRRRLKIDTYTITYSVEGGELQPMFFSPSKPDDAENTAISNRLLAEGLQQIGWAAITDQPLFQTILDFQFALEQPEGHHHRLIYLWRAVEEILWVYCPDDGKERLGPPYAITAEALGLYRRKSNKDEWINEIAVLAHDYARHSQGRTKRREISIMQLPSYVKVAEDRVAEMIIRHAQKLKNPETNFSKPQADLLTGWLAD